MTLAATTKPLLKPRVHRHVVKTLAQRILDNEFPPGSVLPSEPELCETFSVSRSAVREAVKVLDSKGMVTTRPRIGTVVRAREEWNLLDPDVLAWSMELHPSAELVLSLIEARQVIEPAAARFAALRATATDIAPLEDAFARMSRHKASQDFEAFNKADIDFHTALLRASGNIVFQQLSNTIGAALAYSFRLTIARAREPGASLANHGEVIERIRLRDSEGAFASMARLLNIALVDLGLSGVPEDRQG
ncbi:MAG: FadR family transcriptional regulator [Devosia sp.]|uniref:FadR/GntR family transcriptional regulator n=1 Tax=unclassified Devosia TaxID=196773 RepID=UPI0019EF1B9A|nr:MULTISPECIES: FadR/GntR family transcriptional regulator [unclassified Devosia]MBF0679858.1 FadR family transcriptional regulator [Devosia sp.]WEJ34581.1 FadR family transcriptional regulator [Devosia sp. SD17-2]